MEASVALAEHIVLVKQIRLVVQKYAKKEYDTPNRFAALE